MLFYFTSLRSNLYIPQCVLGTLPHLVVPSVRFDGYESYDRAFSRLQSGMSPTSWSPLRILHAKEVDNVKVDIEVRSTHIDSHKAKFSPIGEVPTREKLSHDEVLWMRTSSSTCGWSLSSIWRANYLGIIFWQGLGIIFGFLLFLLLCFPAFPAFPASLLFRFFAFLLLLLLAFSAFLLFCFSCFSASLLFCFFAFLFFLFLCFSAFPAFPASLLFCFSCFFAFLLFCFCAFPVSLLLCFFLALPALNTWFSCKMHFAQYFYIPEYHMTNLLLKTSNVTCEKRCLHSALGGGRPPLPFFF